MAVVEQDSVEMRLSSVRIKSGLVRLCGRTAVVPPFSL